MKSRQWDNLIFKASWFDNNIISGGGGRRLATIELPDAAFKYKVGGSFGVNVRGHFKIVWQTVTSCPGVMDALHLVWGRLMLASDWPVTPQLAL